MPNHITNKLCIVGTEEQVKSVLNFVNGESEFDFNKIIQMPESLNIDSSSDGEKGMQYLLYKYEPCTYSNFKETHDIVESYPKSRKEKVIELGRQYIVNVGKYGYTTWYEWRLQNWGTKWNAYDIEIEDDYTIYFSTAWCGVPDLIGVLSTYFPDIVFEYSFADEDVSCNTGRGIIKNGNIEMCYPDNGSGEAWDIFFETHPYEKDWYECVDGEYKPKEEFC